jgi:hypothetical protein
MPLERKTGEAIPGIPDYMPGFHPRSTSFLIDVQDPTGSKLPPGRRDDRPELLGRRERPPSRRLTSEIDQSWSALMISPLALVPSANQTNWLMELLMNLTLPSAISVLTPPEWKLSASPYIDRDPEPRLPQ